MNSAAYKIIKGAVWLFTTKFKISGEENLPEEPCIIVGNHCHMYGPISAELYTPGDHYTWCVADMMDRKTVPEYAFNDFWSNKPKRSRWFYRILSHVIAPLSELIFTNANTVGVYRDMRVIRTFKETVSKMTEGANMVIFPESYEPRNNIVYEFQDRFVDVAHMYYKKTGKNVSFVPMYLAPKLKTIYYGKPIEYDALNDAAIERTRITEYLMNTITDMATALPKHTVIPYPNVAKKEYKKNIPLENYYV